MLFGKKRKELQAEQEAQKAILERIRNRKVLYVASRDEGGETILCREAVINIIDEKEIAIYSENREVLRMELSKAKLGELMSLGGAIISGEDVNGRQISVVAYYTSDIQRER